MVPSPPVAPERHSGLESEPAPGRALLFAAACGGIASVSFAPAIHANFLSALSRDFGLDNAGSSLYLSLNFWGALFAVIVAGPAAGRLGSRPLLVGAWILELVAVAAIGLAPLPVVAYAGVLAASLAFGTITVLMPHLVSSLYPERRTQALSLLVSFFTIGAVVSNTLVLALFALGASWRTGYLAASALALPWGVLLAASRGPLFHQPARARRPSPPVGHPGDTAGLRTALLLFAAICVAQMAGSAAEVSTSMWVPTFLVREAGAPPFYGPISLLLFCVGGALGKLCNAWAVHRVDERVLLSTGTAFFVGGLLLASLSSGAGAALAGFSLAGLGTGGFMPAVTVRMANSFPSASPSRYSLFMAVGNLGPIGGPVLIGMAAAGDLRKGMLTMLPAALACFVLLLATRSGGTRAAKASGTSA